MNVMKVFILFLIFFSQQVFAQTVTITSAPDVKYLKTKLRQEKFSPRFINALLKNYDETSFAPALRLNMLGFLNPPQHGVLVTDEGLAKSLEFIEANKKAFLRVERRDKVPASVIAALLWIETKHGRITGRYHVLSAFGHLIQATRTDVRNEVTKLAIEIESTKPEPRKNLWKSMRERSKRKSKWAIDQLKALEKLHKKDKKMVEELQGSFAGAFGMAQFIPSSYWIYAKPIKAGTVADLYNPEDAISSVGNYLKKEGWNSKKRSRQMKALMHYNNSQDYAESILDLSEKITQAQQSTPSTQTTNQ